ncbi:hypothetical protein X157_04081 [Mycobacterium tuberculosis BTB09-453]|nr:hypothetical protein X157_04081 [Mycobacterium tuberculosis BTB09-453]
MSSDPKPREGTETCIRKVRTLETLPTCRQTQNPERGRKPASGKSVRSKRFQRVVRPKTPRGDGNLHPESPYARNASNVSSDPKPREGTETHPTRYRWRASFIESSDPKPREGTETRKRSTSLTILFSRRQTQNPERGRKLNNTFFERGAVESVVRPKTPRGDGNILSANSSTVPLSGRQTQNPERGRKRPVDGGCVVRASVVRPKTPRGDGNAPWMADALCAQVSSDPKPREGTETSTPSVPHTGPVPCRQTQNPERGRKLDAESHRVREVQQSSDPKPREGTETRGAAWHGRRG